MLRLVTLLSVVHRTVGETLRGRVVTYIAGSAVLEENTEAAVDAAELPVRAEIRELLTEVAGLRQELAELRQREP